MTPARRELLTSIALCLVGSGLVLLAVRQPWATYPTSDSLTIKDVRTGVAGTAVAGLAQALSLVGLAGVVAIAATKRLGRVVVGTLVVLAGLVAAADVGYLMSDGLGHRLASAGCSKLCIVSQEQYDQAPRWVWPVLAVAGGLVMAAGGALVAARGRRWAALSSSYQVPAARSAATEPTDKATWDLLDSGEDPTA
ncbi:MAG: Trp biosynthesis associated, transrane protein Oprn/Chp [Frankiales bacterium]|nr:Trp biosynthesis associated, transrane protein Oprn/Chp [Frankiales bacterium]